jgi:hypothetical protein
MHGTWTHKCRGVSGMRKKSIKNVPPYHFLSFSMSTVVWLLKDPGTTGVDPIIIEQNVAFSYCVPQEYNGGAYRQLRDEDNTVHVAALSDQMCTYFVDPALPRAMLAAIVAHCYSRQLAPSYGNTCRRHGEDWTMKHKANILISYI